MSKGLKVFLAAIAVLIVLVVGAAAYLGLMPGISKPRDLGIKYTEQNFTDYEKKIGDSYDTMASASALDQTIQYSGSHDTETTITSSEASARINYSKWAYMPLSNAQVKFNTDGSFEVSGNIRIDRMDGFIRSIGGIKYSKADMEKGLGYLGVIKSNPPAYAKAKPVIKDNKVSVQIETIEVGRIKVPLEKVDANEFFASLTEQIFGRINGFHADSITISDNTLNFNGKMPDKTTVLTTR
jgi:hypothetical protein